MPNESFNIAIVGVIELLHKTDHGRLCTNALGNVSRPFPFPHQNKPFTPATLSTTT